MCACVAKPIESKFFVAIFSGSQLSCYSLCVRLSIEPNLAMEPEGMMPLEQDRKVKKSTAAPAISIVV